MTLDIPRTARARLPGRVLCLPALLPLALGATATEIPGSSSVLAAPVPSGEVVITEFMKDPATVSDTRGEWIEIVNTMPWRVNLEGWALADDVGSLHVIANGGLGLHMRPGQVLVLGRSADPALNGGVAVDYVFSGFSLSNAADQILLVKPSGRLSDRVAYDDQAWPSAPGRSTSLSAAFLDSRANDDPLNWCLSTPPLSATNPDTGTPGTPNELCP
jgi:hypothetical protein